MGLPPDELTHATPSQERHGPADRPESDPQVAEVVALLSGLLGSDLLGAYLHGSAVLGGLRPRSDLDILAVSRRPATPDERCRLAGRLLALSGAGPAGSGRSVELTLVVQSDVRPWRYPPGFDFQYGDWWRTEFERGNLAPWPTTTNPDLAILLTMVLLANRPLLGPPPADLLDPVPHADYVRAMVDETDTLLGDLGWDTRNVLLTLARIWSSVATDLIRPKDAAATWALGRLLPEHQPVLARARAIYLGETDERWDDLQPRVRPCAEAMIGEIRRLATSVPTDGPARTMRLQD